jgi:hypothetical protein
MDTHQGLEHIKRLLRSYGRWVDYHIANGWKGYLLTFTFSRLSGSAPSQIKAMKKHLGWFYGRLAKASVLNASSPQGSSLLPRLILAPD